MVYVLNGGFVHCRLSWSTDASKWQWVDPGGLTGRDFIPLGAGTLEGKCIGKWEPVASTHNLSDCDLYRKGQKPEHYICTGATVEQIDDLTLDQCRGKCAGNSECGVLRWQGMEKYNYS